MNYPLHFVAKSNLITIAIKSYYLISVEVNAYCLSLLEI